MVCCLLKYCQEKIWGKELTSWGEPGVPLLPKPLRDLWAAERLPDWISSECGLPQGSTLAALDTNVWQNLSAFSPRLERYVLALLDTRYIAIRTSPALDRPWHKHGYRTRRPTS
jgi:hypothetical protein